MNEDTLAILRAAQVNASVARAMIRVAAMQAANSQFPQDQPYMEKDFMAVIDEEYIGHNAVLMTMGL